MPTITALTTVSISTLEVIEMGFPSSHTNPVLDYSSLLSSGTVTLQNGLNVDVETSVGHAKVNFPAGVTITGPLSWNGIINLPTVKPSDSVSSLPPSAVVIKVLEIGANDLLLTTDKAIRLAFVGDAGSGVGYSHNDPLHVISTGCTDDTQTTNNGLPSAGDCNTSVGSDLIVWARHFSSFVVFQILHHGVDYPTGFAPSFTTGFSQGEYPLSINSNSYSLPNYTNTGPINTISVGSPFVIRVLLYGDNGPQSIQHLSLATNIREGQTIPNADTMLEWDASQPLTVIDPNHFFGPITASSTVVNNKFQITFQGTFDKPMTLSDIGIRTWGSDHHSRDTYVKNTWQSIQDKRIMPNNPTTDSKIINTSPNTMVAENTDNINKPVTSENRNDLITSVKEWAGYSPTAISDSQMLNSIGYEGDHIPLWVMRNVAKYLVDDEITPDGFTDIIKYLIYNHVIK